MSEVRAVVPRAGGRQVARSLVKERCLPRKARRASKSAGLGAGAERAARAGAQMRHPLLMGHMGRVAGIGVPGRGH